MFMHPDVCTLDIEADTLAGGGGSHSLHTAHTREPEKLKRYQIQHYPEAAFSCSQSRFCGQVFKLAILKFAEPTPVAQVGSGRDANMASCGMYI